jgi:cell division protease FtsH
VTSADKLENIASSLRNVGGFERFMSLPDQSLETLAEHFIKKIGRNICSESLLSATGKLGKLLKSETDSQRKLAIPYMQRLHCRENRLIEFVDLVHAFSRSLQEEGAAGIETDELRNQVAYHEAGHAVVAALDSDGKNIPEYASIVPSVAFAGIVIESYAFHHAHDDLNTYRNFRHQIRIGLAGRAAEEVKFGIENVSSASSGDLESASRSAFKAFLYWGFVPQMETSDRTARNLGVVFGQPSDSEMSHAEALVREFMEQEYNVVKVMLEQNRSLLDAIATRLIKEPILDQDELGKLFSENAVALI